MGHFHTLFCRQRFVFSSYSLSICVCMNMRRVDAAFLFVLVCHSFGQLVTANDPASCLACPASVRNSIQQFCSLPLLPFLLSKENCIKMETKNTNEQLSKKVCEPLGICGSKSLDCNQCKLTYKSVLDNLCIDIDGYLFNWGFFKQSYADLCRLFVHISPPDFFTTACNKVGCGIKKPTKPQPKPTPKPT